MSDPHELLNALTAALVACDMLRDRPRHPQREVILTRLHGALHRLNRGMTRADAG